MKKNLFILFFVSISLISIKLNAQESLNASGGDITGSNGNASFSIGQVFYTANLSANNFEIQGVQQPYEISIISGIQDKGLNADVMVYPNPAAEYISINVYGIKEAAKFKLFAADGKLIREGDLINVLTQLDMSELPPAIYNLEINQNNNKTEYKIIKN